MKSNGRRTIRRIRNELAIETVLLVIGFGLAFGLTTKVVVAIAFACVKFAFPDWGTAWLVARFDPDRWHGIAVSLLFVAMGFLRASVVAFALLLVLLGILLVSGRPPKGLVAAGFGTGFLCAYGFLATIFPLALGATLISWESNRKLEFASGLTKLRRRAEDDQQEDRLNVGKSLKTIGIASGISLAVSLILPMFYVASLIFFFAAFVAPMIWMPIFWSVTASSEAKREF